MHRYINDKFDKSIFAVGYTLPKIWLAMRDGQVMAQKLQYKPKCTRHPNDTAHKPSIFAI